MAYVGGQALIDRLFALADPALETAERRALMNALEADYRPLAVRDLISLSQLLVEMGNHDCLSTMLKFWTGDSRHGGYPIEHGENPQQGT